MRQFAACEILQVWFKRSDDRNGEKCTVESSSYELLVKELEQLRSAVWQFNTVKTNRERGLVREEVMWNTAVNADRRN